MANIATNQCIFKGKCGNIRNLHKHLESIEFEMNLGIENSINEDYEFDEEVSVDDCFDSKWTQPNELLSEWSKAFNLEIIGTTFEQGCEYISIWRFRNGIGEISELGESGIEISRFPRDKSLGIILQAA